MGRFAPRPLSEALAKVRREAAPKTLLGEVQAAWGRALGPAIAAAAEPVGERDGVLSVACTSAVWAAELDLMQADLLTRLNAELGGERLARIRVSTAPSAPPSR
jgi:predicted nucleic acid-binding Zn ribbon protein